MTTRQGFVPKGHEFIDGAAITRRTERFEAEARQRTDGAHMWVFSLMHRLTETQAAEASQRGGIISGLMDHETLVMAGGPICYRCEAVDYTSDPCPGYRDVIREGDDQ